MKYYLIVWTFCVISSVKSLECGLSSTQNQEDLKRYTNICMIKASRNDQFPVDTSSQIDDASYEDINDSSLEEAVDNKKTLNMESRLSVEQKLMKALKDDVMNNNSMQNEDNLNDTEISDNCVIQCVFKQLGMVDSSGYPDHGRISENLVKGAENRELKDFLQDSTDECFEIMEQEPHMDSCQFSTLIIKCLADKGKANCSDWPMTDLPFAHLL